MSQVKRKQYKSVKSGKKRSVLYVLILVIVAIISCGMFYIAENISYKPPKAEENALAGLPEPKESFMFSTIETDYGFSINMAANLYMQEDGALFVYFTNVEENDVRMMCEIVQEGTETTLYKTGILNPGEYVEKLDPVIVVGNTTRLNNPVTEIENEKKDIIIRIYAFEEENWYSAGTVEITSLLQPW